MTESDVLSLLDDGVEAFNAWRIEHPDAEVDLTDADLSGRDLAGLDLGGAKLTRARFTNANLIGARFDE
ncbi:MAG: hypothetical protein JWN41_973, partial [Thermoleophilia bacterium]|nr:hypothetical protein [Thermoleophilia bacterium]